MSQALLVYAHPYPDRSRANRILSDAVRTLPGVVTHALYDRYPDFSIDIEAEQKALLAADLVIWQHPLYWYTVPALLKLWWEKVLAHGWAYGAGGNALVGKRCLWVTTSGGDAASYGPSGMHVSPFADYEPVVRQTARFCGMQWESPLILHGAHQVHETELFTFAGAYRQRVMSLMAVPVAASPTMAGERDGMLRLVPSAAEGGER